MNDDSSKPEKWPFAEPQPIREEQVQNAVNFLSHPKVRGTPMVHRFSFLERKGLSREEIEEAFRRCPDPPTSEGAKTIASPEGMVSAPSSQAQAVQPASGPSSSIVPARSRPHWSQLILGAGLIAAAGAGTGYLVQRVLAPKLRSWLRDIIQEEKKATESKREGQGTGPKLNSLEELVGVAVSAAADAAAAAAGEVASSSNLPKLEDEGWQHLKSLIKTLESKTEELKGTLTLMSKDSQDAEMQMVSNAYAHVEGARSDNSAEEIQMKQGAEVLQAANVVDKTSSNFMSESESEDRAWWDRMRFADKK